MQLSLPAPAFMARLFGLGARPRVTRLYAAHVRAGTTREIGPPPGTVGTVTLHCRDGEAWITHDGDLRDVLLQPNESYRVDSSGRMMLHALQGDCVLEIQVDE